jgi:hypothetical protein
VWRFLPFLLAIVLLPSLAEGAQVSRTVISGGDLPHPVNMTQADADAFTRRLNRPPRFEEPPPVIPDLFYKVTSPYWATALISTRVERPPAEDEAFYYPEGGYVRARQGGEDVWIVIDLRQQASLNRYIRLVRDQGLEGVPGTLQVLVAAARSEPIAVTIGARTLNDAETRVFWSVADGLRPSASVARPEDREALLANPDNVWLTFTLPEGRSIEMRYWFDGRLVDPELTEFYGVPPGWLRPVLGADAPVPGRPFGNGAAQIEQQPGRGSPLWWVVMLGGGAACLAAAFWSQRRVLAR